MTVMAWRQQMKATIKSIVSAINRFLDVPSPDPDDARRRKLLNILLLFLLAGTFVNALVASVAMFTGLMPPPPTASLAGLEIPLFLSSIPMAIITRIIPAL